MQACLHSLDNITAEWVVLVAMVIKVFCMLMLLVLRLAGRCMCGCQMQVYSKGEEVVMEGDNVNSV